MTVLAIQIYRFRIKTKIPYSDWPQIAKAYLEEQGLHYERFLYYFEDVYDACGKAVKNAPSLGPVRELDDRGRRMQYLSNIEDGIGCSEEEIMALMPKIHRRYGFWSTHVIFQDIDFFSRKIPAIIRGPGNVPDCIKGASIVCFRDSVFASENYLDLRIITYDGENTYDPAPYLEAMKRHLPGIKYESFVGCCMTEAEERAYEVLNREAAPLVERFSGWLGDKLPAIPEKLVYSAENGKLSLVSKLKKLCKQYGYTYVQYISYLFLIRKRTPKGHYLLIDIDTGVYYHQISFVVRFAGVGFRYQIAESSFFQANGGDVDQFLEDCFAALAAAEKEVLPLLDAHFPATPDWFTPIQ
jgi:hypothetical protein